MKARPALGISMVLAALGVSGFAFRNDEKRDVQADQQLRAMSDELQRSKSLKLNELESPYFIQYVSSDAEQLSVSGTLGGLTHSSKIRLRRPSLTVRVGSYAFDNTNSIFSATPRFGLLPLDNDYLAIRTSFWRTTDGVYKSAAGQITAKRNALREMSDPDKTPDLAPARAVQIIEPVSSVELDERSWDAVMREVSARFTAHPEVLTSGAQMQGIASTYRLVNSEGTVLRTPQRLNEIQIRASAKAPDGQRVWSSQFFTVENLKQFPDETKLNKVADEIATQTEVLAKAPLAEDYTGPVIFEQEAAAQMMAQVLTDAVTLHRKPLAPPGANSRVPQVLDSVWASRLGSKVMPDWITVFDDPTEEEYQGVPLAGRYRVDDEGVPAQRVSLVEKGTLKGFLLSRLPVRTFNASNGHGRLPGAFGSEEAEIGNLFIEVSQPVAERELKAKLLERVQAAGLKYGLIIRRLDFPSTATLNELQSMARQLENSGSARTLDQPLLAYRVYPDGREELVRGLRFREFSAKDLRDLEAASNRPYVLNYVNNGSSLNLADMRIEITTSSVVCPSLLFDSVELTRAENEVGSPPIVSPPSLIAER
jgi:TldD protein